MCLSNQIDQLQIDFPTNFAWSNCWINQIFHRKSLTTMAKENVQLKHTRLAIDFIERFDFWPFVSYLNFCIWHKTWRCEWSKLSTLIIFANQNGWVRVSIHFDFIFASFNFLLYFFNSLENFTPLDANCFEATGFIFFFSHIRKIGRFEVSRLWVYVDRCTRLAMTISRFAGFFIRNFSPNIKPKRNGQTI